MVAFQIIYTVQDDKGKTATTAINVPTTFSLSQFGEFGSGMATLLDALLGGKVVGADLSVGIDISGLTSNVGLAAADVEEIGAFQFTTLNGFPVRVNVPCINELVVASGTDDLNQADPDVAAFIAAMENGLATPGGTVSPTDVAEDDIVSTDFARERFRASGTRR